MRKEYLYYQIASMGNNYSVEGHRGSWTEYLEEHFQIIETGFQFPRLAVQEPQGVMVLRVSIMLCPSLPPTDLQRSAVKVTAVRVTIGFGDSLCSQKRTPLY